MQASIEFSHESAPRGMFPNPAYRSCTWPITQHMKLVVQGSLHAFLYAACTYTSYAQHAERINEYLVANGIVPPNIRQDSQLSDIWRDYQQVLPELGFMYSTKLTRGEIRPTVCGLHLLDNQDHYKEILTGQVLLYQYPNGGKREYAAEQIANGVLLRPAVLVWRVISLIRQRGGNPSLRSNEVRDYLMHCCTHGDAAACADAIIEFRRSGTGLPANAITNSGRNATDWIGLLASTLLFKLESSGGNIKVVGLSDYALHNFTELDKMMVDLEASSSFWNPAFIDNAVRQEWYAFYGALRLEVNLPGEVEADDDDDDDETNGDEQETGFGNVGGVNLTEFNSSRLNFNHENRGRQGRTIESSYDADMVANRYRLHELMVSHIGNLCESKGAQVFKDARTLDLLVRYEETEFLIEVKTITPRNYVKRLRYALGQLLHYDFMLKQELPNRRKVIAFPTLVPRAPALIPFFNSHLDIDLLSLVPTSSGQVIHCDSTNQTSRRLFAIA